MYITKRKRQGQRQRQRQRQRERHRRRKSLKLENANLHLFRIRIRAGKLSDIGKHTRTRRPLLPSWFHLNFTKLIRPEMAGFQLWLIHFLGNDWDGQNSSPLFFYWQKISTSLLVWTLGFFEGNMGLEFEEDGFIGAVSWAFCIFSTFETFVPEKHGLPWWLFHSPLC